MTPPQLRPRSRTVAIAAAVFFAAYVVFLVRGRSYGQTLLTIDDLILVVVPVLPLVFSFLAARSTRGRLRRAWWTLTAGLLCWTLAEWFWMINKYVWRADPVPSPADVFWLLWPLIACAALLLFWDGGPRQSRSRVLLDGIIVGGSLFLVSWSVSMSDVYRTGAATTLEFFFAMAYPLLDWVLVTVAAIVLVNAQSRLRLVLTLMTLGLMSMAANSTGYAYLSTLLGYSSADVVNIGWVAGHLLLTVAAAYGREPAPEGESAAEKPGWASVWLPFAPLMAAAGVLVYGRADVTVTLLVEAIAVLLVVAVLARQFMAVRESRHQLASVAEQALRDPLTGLDNRARFAERLADALRRRRGTGRSVAVLSLDLDNFKVINDTLGHPAGDEMLTSVGRRITEAVGADGTVARLGGDEFAVMVEGDPDLPDRVARRILAAFGTPISLQGLPMLVRPSLGRAGATADRPDVPAEDLMLQADLDMYAQKRSRSPSPSPSPLQANTAEPIELLRQLRRAIDDGDLSLVYQPKVDCRSGAPVGVEALLRWSHPDLGVLLPDQFLPLVRHHGLVESVTSLVIETALDDARDWLASGVPFPVAINVFPPSLATLPDSLGRSLTSRGIPASALTIEITEDFLIEDIDHTRQILAGLRDRGIRISIDDFGTGYSALRYLHDLPVDEVKLDRALISPLAVESNAAVVVRSVIDLAHALGIVIVAEGVETAETADWLRRNGCDVAQGYFFGPPLTAGEVVSLAVPTAGRSS